MNTFDVSYHSKEVNEEVKNLIGQEFGWLQRLRMGGIGSQRFEIIGAPRELEEKMNKSSNTHFCNIEMRKAGIMIWFRIRLHNYGVAIPYRELDADMEGSTLVIRSGEERLILKPAHRARLDKKFILRMMSFDV